MDHQSQPLRKIRWINYRINQFVEQNSFWAECKLDKKLKQSSYFKKLFAKERVMVQEGLKQKESLSQFVHFSTLLNEFDEKNLFEFFKFKITFRRKFSKLTHSVIFWHLFHSQWKGINRKQSTRWQHLSWLKASVFFSLQKNLIMKHRNLYLGLVLPSGGWQRLFKSNCNLECKCLRRVLWLKKILPDGESNPGLPRDRRGYWPLYYRGLEWQREWIFLTILDIRNLWHYVIYFPT